MAYGFDERSAFQEFLQSQFSREHWPFLEDSSAPARRRSPALAEYESAFSSCTICPPQPRPGAFGRHRLILHAYSGRRRRGDFQEFFEACALRCPGLVLHVVSVDVVLSSCWGDVTKRETQQFWYKGIADRYVVGYLAGPPCETRSKAREVQNENTGGRPAPRMVRSLPELWGLSALTIRELRQVSIGNELLLFSLMCLVLLSGQDGCGALEHPAEPVSAHSESIWRTELVRLLTRLPGFNLVTFAQGLLGAKSAKPTTLLTLNLPTMARHIHAHRLCAGLPVASSIGRDSTGSWQTMALKEYPPSLCHALAACFIARVSEYELDTDLVVDDEFWAKCKAMVADLDSQYVGPDFAT